MTENEPTDPAARKPRRALIIALAVVATLGVGAAAAFGATQLFGGGDEAPAKQPQRPAATPTETAEPEEPATPDPIRVIAMGDMLPHDSVNANALQADGSYDYAPFFEGIRTQLDAADVTFCNQEVPSAGVEFGVSGYPTFNAPAEFARDLAGPVGCDLVNLATNHNADKGIEGIAATRGVWDGLSPAIVSGVNRNADEQRELSIFERDGVRIALVSFAEFSNDEIDGTSMNFISDDALVEDLLTRARAEADVVIVSAHWGTEDSHEVNDAQREFARRAAGLGADVVIGTGPHVLQPVEWLDREGGGRTLVWYSIGNMLSTQLELAQRTGIIAGFEIARDADGAVSIEHPTAIPTYTHYDWSAEQEAAGDLLARTDLRIAPLADSDEALARTRFGVTAAQQFETTAGLLGPEVEVRER